MINRVKRFNNFILIGSIVIATIMWFTESVLHYLFFDPGHPFEVIPHDTNELWMRLSICIFVIVAGVYLQRQFNKHVAIEAQKLETLVQTMRTVQDIVGNAMTNLLLFRMEAEESRALTRNSLAQLDKLIFDTTDKISKLANTKVIRTRKIGGDMYAIDIEYDDQGQ